MRLRRAALYRRVAPCQALGNGDARDRSLEGVAPLHAAPTSQRDVLTALNMHPDPAPQIYGALYRSKGLADNRPFECVTSVAAFPDCYPVIPGTQPRRALIRAERGCWFELSDCLNQNLNRGQRMLNSLTQRQDFPRFAVPCIQPRTH